MFVLEELDNTSCSFVHLEHRERDLFHFHERSIEQTGLFQSEIFGYSLTLTTKPFRGEVVSLSSGINRPSKGPMIVVLSIRIVGEKVMVSSHRRI